MPIRELDLNARDLTEELTVPSAPAEKSPLIDPSAPFTGQGDGLDLLSLEELQQLAAQEGIATEGELDTEQMVSQDGLDMLSLEELQALDAQQEAAAKEERERDKIQAAPTTLEFLRGEQDTIKEEVTGRPGFLGDVEQLFRPFATSSILANLMKASRRTAADDERSFQENLRADTGVLEIDQQINLIERTAEAEGRDLTDEELDQLFALQAVRNDIEDKARENFREEGRINIDEEMTFSEIASAIYEQPSEFFRGMANEAAREPELLLAPLGWTKSAQAAATQAKILGASIKQQKIAAVVGGNVGVSALAGSTAYATDAAEQLKEKGVVDTDQAMDTAIVTAAVASALTSAIRGGASVVKDRQVSKQFSQAVDEELGTINSEKLIDDVIEENINTHEVTLDSNNNLVISERPSTEVITDQASLQILRKSREQLIAEQEEALANKLPKADRQVIGQRALVLKEEIPRAWQAILDAEDQLAVLAEDTSRTANRRDSAVRSQRGNLQALRDTHNSMVAELRSLEELLLADRDLGLEIVRISEGHRTELEGTDVLRISDQIKNNMTPEDLSWIERRQRLRNEAELADKKRRPKIMKLFDPEQNKSWEEMGIDPQPPATQLVPKNALKPRSDTAWNLLVDISFGKAVSRIDGLATVSPTAKKLRNIFRHDQEGILPERSHTERVTQSTGRFVQKLEDSMDNIRSDIGAFLDKEGAAEVLRVLRGGSNRAVTPEVTKAAETVRSLLDDFLEYAREAGHPVGKVENYVPRVYNTTHLAKPEVAARFKALLVRKGMDVERVNEVYQKIMDQDGILDFDPKKLSTQRISADTRPLGQRSLDMVDDIELEEFLTNNIYELMRDYIHTGVRTVEFTRSFGVNGQKLYDMLDDIIKETRESGNIVEDVEMKRIIDLANALQGSYNRFQSNVAQTTMSGLVTAQQMIALPFATITSMTEPFIGLGRSRATSWAQGMGKSLKSASNRSIRSFLKNVDKDEVTIEAEELGLILPHATNEHLANLYGGEISTKSLSKVSAAFFRAIFLTQWTEFTRVWAQQAAKMDIVKSLKAISDGGPEFREQALRVDLEASGLDIDAGVNWVRRGADTTDPYYQQIKEASFRDANRVIVHPDPTNRPLHFSNPKLSWFNMLLSYPTTFTNTVMKGWFDGFTKGNAYYKTQHGVKVAAAVLTMLMVSDAVLELKEQLTYGEKGNPNLINETEGERMFRAANQAGFLGPAQLVGDMMSSVKYGGDAASSRAGPLVGTFNDIAAGIVKLPEDDGDSIKKAATKLFPFINKSHDAKEFIYRDILQGGRATRDVEPSAIEFRSLESPRVDRPSIFGPSEFDPNIKDLQKKEGQDQTQRLEQKVDKLVAAVTNLTQQSAPVPKAEGDDVPRIFSSAQAMVATPDNSSAKAFVADAYPQIQQIVEDKAPLLFPEVLTAMTALETGWGKSVKGNSYFGVKSQKGDKDTVTFTTREADAKGNLVKQEDSFKAFQDFQDSVEGVIDFLQDNPRYAKAGVFDAVTPETQIDAIADAGYATDPNYAEKLKQVLNSVNRRLPEEPVEQKTLLKPTPLDPQEVAEEEQFINSLFVNLDESVKENAIRRRRLRPTKKEPALEEVDVEELFDGTDPLTEDILKIKEAFPDATLDEIAEFLKEGGS